MSEAGLIFADSGANQTGLERFPWRFVGIVARQNLIMDLLL